MSLRALGGPREVAVRADGGIPRAVAISDDRYQGVMTIRDDWLVQDLWWTDRAVDRHYFELVLDSGRLVVVYREASEDTWFTHG